MNSGHVLVFEKHDGSSNKFYTMIATGNGTFICNYGINDGLGWHKSLIKNEGLWQSTIDDRLNHGYHRTFIGDVDYWKYQLFTNKLKDLYDKIGENTTLFRHYFILAKFGTLNRVDMIEANELLRLYNVGEMK